MASHTSPSAPTEARARTWRTRWMPMAAPLGMIIFLTAFFLLTAGRDLPAGDDARIVATAEVLVHGGRPLTPPSPAPLLASMIHAPGLALGQIAGHLVPAHAPTARTFGAQLAPAFFAALTCLVFFDLCVLVGVARRRTAIATAGLALTTILAVHAHSPGTPMLEAFLFTAAIHASLAPRRSPLVLGGLLLLLPHANSFFVLAIPGFLAFALWTRRRQDGGITSSFAAALAGPALAGIALLMLDVHLRRESPGAWFGATFAGPFRQDLGMGLWSLVASPGKSLFLFSPPLLLGIFGLRSLARRTLGRLGWLLGMVGLPLVVYLSVYAFWSADWSWGPKRLVFATPVLLLPAAALLDDLILPRHWRAAAGASALAITGLWVQFQGTSLQTDRYVAVAREARSQWLGLPVRSKAWVAENADGCVPCFEDTHTLTWLPPFQPIAGHAWLAEHKRRGDTWIAAEADAAWHRHTSAKFNIEKSYNQVRFNWWGLDFRGPGKSAGILLGMLLFAGLIGGGWMGWRFRSSRSTVDPAS